MKRVVRYLDEPDTIKISVIVEVEMRLKDDPVAAATFDHKELPQGQLLPSEKDAVIDSQVLEDYHAFIESIEDLITDYYDLHIYYKNSSPDNSFYFGMIAKDADNIPIIDFEACIRISNHAASRSPQSQHNKKLMKEALRREVGNAKLKPIRKRIIVNRDEFADYDAAYSAVDELIENVTSKLKKNKTI